MYLHVCPGYDDSRVKKGGPERPRKLGATYDAQWKTVLEATAKEPFFAVAITSFNEWHEGTGIEPVAPKKAKNNKFTYKDYEGSWNLTGSAAELSYIDRTLHWAQKLSNCDDKRSEAQQDVHAETQTPATVSFPPATSFSTHSSTMAPSSNWPVSEQPKHEHLPNSSARPNSSEAPLSCKTDNNVPLHQVATPSPLSPQSPLATTTTTTTSISSTTTAATKEEEDASDEATSPPVAVALLSAFLSLSLLLNLYLSIRLAYILRHREVNITEDVRSGKAAVGFLPY